MAPYPSTTAGALGKVSTFGVVVVPSYAKIQNRG